jgi:UDP-N-acetylmuramyl pentapeptide synthase
VAEILLTYGEPDEARVRTGSSQAAQYLETALADNGIALPEGGFAPAGEAPMECFAAWCSALGLALQTATGHRVSRVGSLAEPQRSRITLWFEHEDSDVGERAGRLALFLLAQAFPRLDWAGPVLSGPREFAELYAEFKGEAQSRVLPRDTEAIIHAAQRAGVPFAKLERDPYEPVQGDFRIRMNSMLMLGHSPYRQVIDGTLALEQARFDLSLVHKRIRALQLMTAEDLPVPAHRHYVQPLVSPGRVRRLKAALGPALVVKPARRSGGRGVGVGMGTGLTQVRDIGRAVEAAMQDGREVLFQEFVPGDTYRLLFANQALTAVLGPDGTALDEGVIHPETIERLTALSFKLNAGLMLATLVTSDASVALEASGGKFVDLEVAPEVDHYTARAPAVLEAAADAFIAWLFPPGAPRRIPIVSITGTNGKTTTTRMINHLLKQAGKAPGMVCTDGVFIGNEVIENQDLSNLIGHYRVFESKQVDCAVLEANHKGLAAFGLSFDWCDVGVVTNVTPDHLGAWGIETVEDMAVVKRSLVERARHMAVLNADDPLCMAMIPHMRSEQLVLTSLETPASELLRAEPRATACISVEGHEGADWVVWHAGKQRQPVIKVAAIPATFDGAARFNVRNAIQAIAACHGLGLDFAVIAAGMAAFGTAPELTPGRLNVYDVLPFKLIVDFAHNPDGLKQLTAFTDTLCAKRRKVVTVASSGDRSDAHHANVVAHLAGHFDYYICREYLQLRGRKPGEVPEILERLLIEHGVQPEQIGRAPGGPESLQHVFALCEPGDLLIYLGGNKEFELVAGHIERYLERHPPSDGSA